MTSAARPHETPVRAVLFDLGGVWLRLRPWEQACAAAGIHGLEAERLRPMDDHPEVADLHLEFECGRLSTDAFMQQTGAILGATPAAVSAVFRARIEGPFPGTHTLLDRLDAANITTGCLSNTNALHWALMLGVFGDQAGPRIPLERLHHRFASQNIGAAKPQAGIYRHAEQALGLPGARIAFFDDRADNLAAAQARGWQAHLIDPDAVQPPAAQITAHLTRMGVFHE